MSNEKGGAMRGAAFGPAVWTIGAISGYVFFLESWGRGKSFDYANVSSFLLRVATASVGSSTASVVLSGRRPGNDRLGDGRRFLSASVSPGEAFNTMGPAAATRAGGEASRSSERVGNRELNNAERNS